MKDALFFIAIVPDAQIQQEVTEFKQYLAEHFGASHALKSPPHITLFPPFKWPQDRVEALLAMLRDFAAPEARFEIMLKNFNAFAPSVIYVDVMPNELLQNFQQRLENQLEKEFDLKNDRGHHGFNPHMTIAHKDLKHGLFAEAWQYFSLQHYARTFEVENIALLQHNGRRWDIYKQFSLGF